MEIILIKLLIKFMKKKIEVNSIFFITKEYDRIKENRGKNMEKKKKVLEEEYNDCWIYILLLTTIVILKESVKNYYFTWNGNMIFYSIFLLPIIFFIVNYIVKKYDYKKAIAAIAISAVTAISYTAVLSFALGKRLILSSITGDFCGYIVAQFINLTIYTFLLNNTKSPYLLVFLTYLFSIIVYYMFYTLIHLNLVIVDGYWAKYFITMAIEFVLCIPTAIIDKKVKRGQP